MVDWLRAGLSLDPRWTGLAPLAALVTGGLGVLLTPSGDIREGLFPWGVALSMALVAGCAVGVVAAHQPEPRRSVLVGGWWSAMAYLAMAGFFIAIGIGGLLGVDEETENPLALFPIAAMTFGLLSSGPALGTLAYGVTRAHRLPSWGAAGAWCAVGAFPALLIFGGLVEGTAESVGSAVIMGAFVGGWITLGLSTRAAAT